MRHGYKRPLGLAALAFFPLVFFVFYLLHPIDEPLLQPDSYTYMEFSSTRTGGYPFFLLLLKPFVDGPAGYVPIQLAIYALAVFSFSYALWRMLDTMFAAVMVQLPLLLNPQSNVFHFSILTDSLFISLMLLFLTACLYTLRSPRLLPLAMASLLAGLTIAVRPTGVAFLPALAVLMLLVRHKHGLWRVLMAAILPCLVTSALESAYYYAHHSDRQSLLPIHMFAKGGLTTVQNPDALIAAAPPNRKALDLTLETDLAKVRQLIAGAPNLGSTCRLMDNYEVFVQYGFLAIPRDPPLVVEGGQAMAAGMARIFAAPFSYGLNMLQHWRCLWTIWGAATEPEMNAFRDYMARNEPVPYLPDIAQEIRPKPFTLLLNISFVALCIIGIATAIAGLLALAAVFGLACPTSLLLSGLAGLTVHAGFVLTAATAVSIPRYTFDFWPALVVGIGMAGWWGLQIIFKRRPL